MVDGAGSTCGRHDQFSDISRVFDGGTIYCCAPMALHISCYADIPLSVPEYCCKWLLGAVLNGIVVFLNDTISQWRTITWTQHAPS